MRKVSNDLILSASDLSNHLACTHLTWLNLRVAISKLEAPAFSNPSLEILKQRGLEFEKAFLQNLRDKNLKIVEPGSADESLTAERTIKAMQEGVDVIYQANLKIDQWQGRADFLLKVSKPSELGDWSYEIADTKLAKETRSGTVLQIAMYSQIIGGIQWVTPEEMHVITPKEGFTKESYRVADYEAFTRLLQRRLIQSVTESRGEVRTYPDLVPHCEICNWWERCSSQRRKDDHLSLVAGLGRGHTAELEKLNITTVESLANQALPLQWKPAKGATETFTKLREQARVQMEARSKGTPVFELLSMQPGLGLNRLPTPSAGDIFFDFEGDPFVGTNGLEYLFGWTYQAQDKEHYNSIWALNANEEKSAFESFIDWIMVRWNQYPDMHIYHYTPYEPSALKRLMGRYASRQEEVDQMLRAGMFVDLYSVARQSIRAGIETYSLKELEIFHDFKRELPLRQAALHLRALEQLLESDNTEELPNGLQAAVSQYNKEDCQSTSSLRDWLESLRTDLIEQGQDLSRPLRGEGNASEDINDFLREIKPIYDQLVAGLDADRANRNDEEQARWLVANMLDWYRREKKSLWWEFFRLTALSQDELLDEKTALSKLQFTNHRRKEKQSWADTYSFPDQDCDIKIEDELIAVDTKKSFGTVVNIDLGLRTIEIKKGDAIKDLHPGAIFSFKNIKDDKKEKSIIRLAQSMLPHDFFGDPQLTCGKDLVQRALPKNLASVPYNSDAQLRAIEWIRLLDKSVLPIQGPPGAGKSHTAAMMILDLLATGKKVGITALSHKVIIGLIEKVLKEAAIRGINIPAIHKAKPNDHLMPAGLTAENDTSKILRSLQNGLVRLVGGTSFFWSGDDLASSVDVLFVDEAGQLSLIDTLAVSQAATNLVLLGDPQQLKQPQQGSHPEGTEVSALEHILGNQKTISAQRGIFLDVTWRMHPAICRFVSELFYENRLHSKSGLENQKLSGDTKYAGAGLWYESVEHAGNQNSSIEEVEKVREIVSQLCNGKMIWINEHNEEKILNEGDIKVISPYNAQVAALKTALPDAVQVGTVDKFQGQEAPVIIFSMATSTPEDAPRGMEFLYSPNRLNVAVSRARSTFILVGSPKLFEPDCRNPAQMKLANAFCRFLELANV